MIFDQPPAELPVATLRSREVGSQFMIDVRHWLAARWRWLRPRTIPVAVAAAGMVGVIASANYLREFAHPEPERVDARIFVPEVMSVDEMVHAPVFEAPAPEPDARVWVHQPHWCSGESKR